MSVLGSRLWARLAPLLGCAAAGVILGGCGGVTARPEAGTPHIWRQPGFRGVVVSQRGFRVACLRDHGYRTRQYYTKVGNLPAIQVGSLPDGPTLIVYPDAGIAEGVMIQGQAQGAEMIGPVLMYPNDTSLAEAKVVESCVAFG